MNGCDYCGSPAYFIEKHGHKPDCSWLAVQKTRERHPSAYVAEPRKPSRLVDVEWYRHRIEYGPYGCDKPGCHYHNEEGRPYDHQLEGDFA